MTELEQAAEYRGLLDANLAGLQEARESGDLRAETAFAGEIADIARSMRSRLRVVVDERHKLTGPR
jgi:hypothetical protein